MLTKIKWKLDFINWLNIWTKNKWYILITWWLWYIWSHAVVEFEKMWYQTIILDNLSNSKIEVLNKINKLIWYSIKFYKEDLMNKKWIEKIFKENNIKWVIHFAWLKAVWESTEKPIEYFQNNIVWSLNLFEIMKKNDVKNIIFSSSATVYDIEKLSYDAKVKIWNDIKIKRWLEENDPIWNTTNPYWKTKYLLEEILMDLAKFSWFNIIALRYFNPIWAHVSWLLWEDPNWIPNNLLPYIMKVYNWELEKLKIFWWDYPTIDWTWVRDYIDVNDLIKWHIKAYKYLEEKIIDWWYETFNLWVWRWLSVIEMISLLEEVTWKRIKYEIVWRRKWDLAEVYCNPKKANDILNWKTEINEKESLKNMIKFYSK